MRTTTPRYEPLPGTAIGVLVLDSQPLGEREGRTGPPDAVAFVRGADSFRWLYLPSRADDLDSDEMTFGLGPDGKRQQTFRVRLATRPLVEELGMTGPFHLIEVEVNDGGGSGPEESFVATKLKRLDGTREFDFRPVDLIKELTKQAQKHFAEKKGLIAEKMAVARKSAGNGRSPTGPEETTDEVLVTWMPNEERLQIVFRRRVTNGFYVVGQGAEGPNSTPTRGGLQFGAIGGIVYEVSKTGRTEKSSAREFKPFTLDLGLPNAIEPQ
jgi:hypothetical protein